MPGIFDAAIFDPAIFDVDVPAPPLDIGGVGGSMPIVWVREPRSVRVITFADPGRVLVQARLRRLLDVALASADARSSFTASGATLDRIRGHADIGAAVERVGLVTSLRERVAASVTTEERQQIRARAQAIGSPDDDERDLLGLPPDA